MSTTVHSPARRGRPGNDRADVVAAAVALFNQHGYEATSVGMIAERLGVSKSAIYHHVASKEELLKQALDRALNSLEAALMSAQAHNPQTPEEHLQQLETLIRATVDVLIHELPSATLLLRLRGNTELERAALDRRRKFDHAVARMVAAAADAGDLAWRSDTRATTRLVFGMINSIIEWYKPGGSLGPKQLGDLVVAIVFEGLRH